LVVGQSEKHKYGARGAGGTIILFTLTESVSGAPDLFFWAEKAGDKPNHVAAASRKKGMGI